MSDWGYTHGLWYANYEWFPGFLVYFEVCKKWNSKIEWINFAGKLENVDTDYFGMHWRLKSIVVEPC